MQSSNDSDLSRRELLMATAASVAIGAAGSGARAEASSEVAQPAIATQSMANVSFTVNGVAQELELDTRTTLLDALREHLHFTGSKKGCDQGQCGACTVIAGGRRTLSCPSLAREHHEGDIGRPSGPRRRDNPP